MFSEWRGSLTQNRRKASLVSRKWLLCILEQGSVHREAIGFLLKSVLGWLAISMELLKVKRGAPEKKWYTSTVACVPRETPFILTLPSIYCLHILTDSFDTQRDVGTSTSQCPRPDYSSYYSVNTRPPLPVPGPLPLLDSTASIGHKFKVTPNVRYSVPCRPEVPTHLGGYSTPHSQKKKNGTPAPC